MGSPSDAVPVRPEAAPKKARKDARKPKPATPAAKPALSRRLQVFVDHYVVGFNATKAALEAGYTREVARKACLILRRPAVAAAIGARLAERRKETLITADRVLQEYARIAFADLRRVAKWGPKGVELREDATLSEGDVAAIAEVTQSGRSRTRVKLHDKRAALDSIARHLGLFTPQPPAYDPKAQHEAATRAREILAQRIAALAAGVKDQDEPPETEG